MKLETSRAPSTPGTTSYTQRLLNDLYRPILKAKRVDPLKPKKNSNQQKPKPLHSAIERKEIELNTTVTLAKNSRTARPTSMYQLPSK